jgi:hypothetical protein
MNITDTIKAKRVVSRFYQFPISGDFASATELKAYIADHMTPENVTKEEITHESAVLEKPNLNAVDFARANGLAAEEEVKSKLEPILRGLPVAERNRILEALRG